MSQSIKRRMFEAVEERAAKGTLRVLVRLRVEMLMHGMLKKEVLENDGNVVAMKQGEGDLVKAIEEVKREIKDV